MAFWQSHSSTLTVKTVLRDEGANLNVYQAVYGKIAQVRAASNLKATIPSAEKRQLYQLDIEPVYPIYRRYTLTGTTGFIIEISADSILTLTPFGGDLAKDTAINFTETFLIKWLKNEGLLQVKCCTFWYVHSCAAVIVGISKPQLTSADIKTQLPFYSRCYLDSFDSWPIKCYQRQ